VIREKVYSILRLSDTFYTIKSFPIHSYYFLKRFENRDVNMIPIYYRNIINFLETDVLFHLKILEKTSKQVFAIRETIQILNDNIKKWNELVLNFTYSDYTHLIFYSHDESFCLADSSLPTLLLDCNNCHWS
jgi:hypothetical protein